MSTYDMYFSKKNKNYMFNTLSQLILQETGYDIKYDSTYIELYRLHYPGIFDMIDTDEISILNKELINNSEVVLSSKILINALDAARVYFKNSTKRFTGFGGGEHEAEQALEIITKALGFPNHRSEARINILFYGFSILRTIKKRYKIDINEYNLGFSSDLQNHLDLYVNQMEELYSHDLSKDKIDKIFSNLSGDDVSFIRKNLTLFQSGDATNSNINDQEKSGCLSKIIIWSLIIGLVGWLLDASVL